MQSSIIQLLVLAAIAVFLILRLRNVLGTRDGFEPSAQDQSAQRRRSEFEVIEGDLAVDADIEAHTDPESAVGKALANMKQIEPSFNVSEFLSGASGAYEMILMAFENGELSDIKPFLGDDVYDAFAGVVEDRKAQGLTIDANFVGVRELTLSGATFDENSNMAEIDVRLVGELTSVVRDRAGDIIEGSATEIKRQRDVWTFAREMGSNDPNWRLVATGE